MVPTRRRFLATGGILLSGGAGCLGFTNPDLVIKNELDQSVVADIDITKNGSQRIILQADRTIETGETATFPGTIDEPGEYLVQVTTREANIGGEKTIQVDDDKSVNIHVSIGSNGVSLVA